MVFRGYVEIIYKEVIRMIVFKNRQAEKVWLFHIFSLQGKPLIRVTTK